MSFVSDAPGLGPREPWSTGNVRDDERDFRRVIGAARRFDERGHVGASPRDQGGGPFAGHGGARHNASRPR